MTSGKNGKRERKMGISQFIALLHVCRDDLKDVRGEQDDAWALGYISALERAESYLRLAEERK